MLQDYSPHAKALGNYYSARIIMRMAIIIMAIMAGHNLWPYI